MNAAGVGVTHLVVTFKDGILKIEQFWAHFGKVLPLRPESDRKMNIAHIFPEKDSALFAIDAKNMRNIYVYIIRQLHILCGEVIFLKRYTNK